MDGPAICSSLTHGAGARKYQVPTGKTPHLKEIRQARDLLASTLIAAVQSSDQVPHVYDGLFLGQALLG